MGNQAEWTQCACKRWMHVDCVSETVADSDGNLRICSFCILSTVCSILYFLIEFLTLSTC